MKATQFWQNYLEAQRSHQYGTGSTALWANADDPRSHGAFATAIESKV